MKVWRGDLIFRFRSMLKNSLQFGTFLFLMLDFNVFLITIMGHSTFYCPNFTPINRVFLMFFWGACSSSSSLYVSCSIFRNLCFKEWGFNYTLLSKNMFYALDIYKNEKCMFFIFLFWRKKYKKVCCSMFQFRYTYILLLLLLYCHYITTRDVVRRWWVCTQLESTRLHTYQASH